MMLTLNIADHRREARRLGETMNGAWQHGPRFLLGSSRCPSCVLPC